MTSRRRSFRVDALRHPLRHSDARRHGISLLVTFGAIGVALSGFASATIAASKAKPSAARVTRVAVVSHISSATRGWYAYGTATKFRATRARTSLGVRAIHTFLNRQSRNGGAAFDAGGHGIAVGPSARYTISTWVRGTGKLRIRVGLHNSKGNSIGYAKLSGSGASFEPKRTRWTRYSVSFTTPRGARSVVVQVGGRVRQKASFLIAGLRLSTTRTLQSGRKKPPRGTTTTDTTTPATTTTVTTTTVPTTTVTTTTVPTTTTAPTTTTTPTTTSWAPTTYQQAISYTLTRPAFTPTRTVAVTTASQLLTAMAGLRCGDLIKATAAFTMSSEWEINQNPTCATVVDLTGVTIAYTGASALPSVWIHGASNISLYGGDIHGPAAGLPGNGGILVYKASNIRWWGFHVHNVAHDGLDLFPVGGAIDGCDFQGEIDHWGGYSADDPHAEKGTGFHGANIADAGTGIVTNTRIALYVHDGPTGAGVEIGTGTSTGRISGLTMYLKAVNLTKQATSQVAGNAIQEWGAVPITMKVPYLEATNLQGRANDGQGIYSGVSMSGINVTYGRATSTNLNPYLSRTESGIAGTDPWDKRRGQLYSNVL